MCYLECPNKNVMDPYFKFLNEISSIPEATFLKLQQLSEKKYLPANTIVAEAGKIPSRVYLLREGVLRAYIVSESGKQHNKRLYSPVSFAGALTAMIKRESSNITFETLTDCKVFEIDFYGVMELCKTDPVINRLYTRILELTFIAYEDRNLDLLTLSATERYKKLRKQIPNIDDLIPQYQIASYINVTPVQLSRIRKNLLL